MTLYFYLQIKPVRDILFASPLKDWLQKEVSKLVHFEADNHSDTFLIKKGQEFIQQAETIILHFDVRNDESIGQIGKLLEEMRKSGKTAKCFIEGKHEILSKMLRVIGVEPVKANSFGDIKSRVKA